MNEFQNDLTTYVIIIITQKDIKIIMLWNYDTRSINSSPRIFISYLCFFINKIVVYYFKGIVNVIIHVLRVESRLYRNGADIAAAYVCCWSS